MGYIYQFINDDVIKGGVIMQFVWLGIAVLAVILEAVTYALVSVWFIPAALISMILAFCNVGLPIQIGVFIVVSLLLLIFLRPITTKFLKVKRVPTNADSLIGKKVVITEKVDNIQSTGAGKIQGRVWSVRANEDNVIFEAGDVVTIDKIEGVKLICSK